MNLHEQDNSDERANEREFGEVIEQLDHLADALDRQRYPGEAWPARRVHRRKTKLLWRVAAGAAAAAAIILLAMLVRPEPKKDDAPTPNHRLGNGQLVENGWEDDHIEFGWGEADIDPDLEFPGEYEIADSSEAATDILFDIYNPLPPADAEDDQGQGSPNTTWPKAPDTNGNGNHDS